jgi:hypothetical protein
VYRQLRSLFHEDRKLGWTARLRESEFDGIQVDNVLMADLYETLDLLLNRLQLLTALRRSVVLRVKSDQIYLERKRRRNVITNRFCLIDRPETICGCSELQDYMVLKDN